MSGQAIIIGAGVAGLATAVALRDAGWGVTVHDRAKGLAPGGTALGMWPEAMSALERLGVADGIRRHAAHSRGAALLDPRGMIIGRIPPTRSAHLVSRERLLSALLDRLPADAVHWGQRFASSDEFPTYDLVVGADGIHSLVRRRHWGSAVERALGTVAFRGVIDRPTASVSETWGRGALFGVTPMDEGRTNWFACLRRDPVGRSEEPAALLRDAFESWHPGVRAVLAELEGVEIDRRSLFDVRLPHPYARGNVVLIGDAAHAMAPNLGRGACESLIDAVTLARALDTEPEVASALRRYDRARRPATRRIVRTARTLNRIATAERGTRFRDAAVRALLTGSSISA